jgi:transcriptional antiterminator RfaH
LPHDAKYAIKVPFPSTENLFEVETMPEAHWYLVRTKPGKERWVRDQLAELSPDVFLPLLRARMPRWGKLAISVAPLFPCYLFARLDLSEHYFGVRYLPGVSGLVCAGSEPAIVPEEIIHEIRRRGVDDIVEIIEKPSGNGERVKVVDGPFRGFEAVFERYLSGAERVAILLSALEASGTGLRVVLPASALAKAN